MKISRISRISKIILLILLLYIIGTLIRITRYTTVSPRFSTEITFNLPDGVLPYNSCISKENGNYVVYTRIDNCGTSNFDKVRRYMLGIMLDRTPVFLGKTTFDKNFNVIDQMIVDPTPGIMMEDLRVFFWKGDKYFIGTKWEGEFYPCVLKESGENYEIYEILDEKGEKYKRNKNFMPINIGNELCLIKNHNPLQIDRVLIDNKNKVFYTKPYFSSSFRGDIPKLRGNTPYIDIGYKKYLGITHTLNSWMGKNYVHHVTIINAQDPMNIYIEKVGSSMCLLGNCGIEFVMGLVESYEKGKYVITLGKEDMSAHLVEVTSEEIEGYFE